MTVTEVIEELKKFNPSALLVTGEMDATVYDIHEWQGQVFLRFADVNDLNTTDLDAL